MSLATNLAASPAWLPHSIDESEDRLLFAHLTQDQYRAASFLDGRMLGSGVKTQWVPFADVLAALPPPRPLHAIFHIGHVGSTLIARLLGEVPGLFALREPAALRTLAEWRDVPHAWWTRLQVEARLDACLTLYSRTWAPGDTAFVKATSFASELAPAFLARPGARAVALGDPAQDYLATILAQDGNRAESRALAPSRLERLNRRLGAGAFHLADMSEGERVAMAWASETLTIADAAGTAGSSAAPVTQAFAAASPAPEPVFATTFAAFLATPAPTLVALARHFGADLSEAAAHALVTGPLMARYAKGPEHAYSPRLRADLLAQARREHAHEIRRGMTWLERAAAHPALAAVLKD